MVDAVRWLVPDDEAPVPIAVFVEPLPAVEPPAASEEEVPLRLPDVDAPVPSAVLVEPFPAVAPPTPRLEDVPPLAP